MANLVKRVLFLGRKPLAVKAAQFLLNKNIRIGLIVAPAEDLLNKFAKLNNIPIIHNDKILYRMIEKNDKKIRDIDLVISYLYLRKIKMPLIKLGSRGCINFHPAPLPDYKGRAGYNTAILEDRRSFGVSAHFIDSEEFDVGPIIRVLRFPIEPNENVMTLIDKTQKKLLVLFKQVIKLFMTKSKIKTYKNVGGLYLNKVQLEELKIVNPEKDSLEGIYKKIRAFFFPPYHGANIEIKGKKFTLVNEEMLKYLSQILNK